MKAKCTSMFFNRRVTMSTFGPQRFVDTGDLCAMDIHHLLWTSMDLKAHAKNLTYLRSALKHKRVTMLCSCQNNCINLIVQSALKTLGADLRTMFATRWEQSMFKKDIGRIYSLFSDMIVVQAESHQSVCELAKGAKVPVVNMGSHKFAPLHGLAVLMTLQERFGRLTGLTLGWVGPMGSHLNTLIYLLPKVGVNLRYNNSPRPSYPGSPLVLNKGLVFCDTYKTDIVSCSTVEETVAGVDAIATAKHRQDTVRLELAMCELASDQWVFLHLLPRWEDDVSEELFNHKKSLVWTLHENMEYATMAVMLNVLNFYSPVVARPNFNKSIQ